MRHQINEVNKKLDISFWKISSNILGKSGIILYQLFLLPFDSKKLDLSFCGITSKHLVKT